MKILKSALLSVFVGALVASCDFLEKEPTKLTPEVYFNTAEEANSFLTGVYAILNQETFYASSYLWVVGADDLSHYGGGGRSPMTGVICNNIVTSDPDLTKLWYNLYVGINRASMFLENIDRVKEINEDTRQQYIAEAKFLRAFYYFTLVQGWGDVPFKEHSTNSVIGLDLPRTDKQKIYDFIIREMDDAAENGLSSAAELNYTTGRISKSAAWGIIARVYLFRAGEHFREKREANANETTTYFAKASEYAQKVMREGHGLVGLYGDFFIDLCSDVQNTALTEEGAKANESIWEVDLSGDYTDDMRTEGRIGNLLGLWGPDLSQYASLTDKKDPGFCYEYIFATPKLYDLYEANNDKERFLWNIAPFRYQQSNGTVSGVTGREFKQGLMADYMKYYGDKGYSYGPKTADKVGDYEETKLDLNKGRGCAKYRREYEKDKKDKNNTYINFPVLRYADILLMVAEAENEINSAPSTLAFQCINDVRKRAGLGTLQGLGKDEFRQAVKDERAMELCFEYTRRYDLLRWGELIKNMNELVPRAQEGVDWSQGPTNVFSYFMLSEIYNYLPIPDAEMSTNKAINGNNPGW